NFSPCDLLQIETHPQRNTISAKTEFSVDYFRNGPIDIRITILDHDRFSGPDLVGEYRTTLTPSSLLSHQTLDSGEVRSHHRELPGTVMKIDASKVCKPDHYGRECKFCQVSSERGYCTAVGDEVCISGYFGPSCAQIDYCQDSNCADFATCENDNGSAKCLCDGISGERCERGFDPCANYSCSNNGTCARTGVNKNFAECVNCSRGWKGAHCEEQVDSCEWEELLLGRPPCENNGLCVSRKHGREFTCLCEDGWQGARCETSFTKASATVAIVVLCLVLFLCILVIAIAFCIRIFLLPKLRMLFRRGNAVEMQVVKSDYHNDLSRANNLYEELEGPAMTVQKPDKYFDEYESVSNSFYASQTCIASMQQPPLRDPPVVTANDGHKFHSSSDKESLSEIYTSLKSVTIPTPHETNEEDYETIIKKESTFGSRNTADNSGVFISQGIEDRGHSKCTGENIQDVERSPSNESGNADYDDCDVYEFIDNGVLNNNE
uniref:EGF-like domain-containing protein n=1 Tax=Mesocestoides corti TaxID=53468 RepID=A0A5K3FSZ4_MESCO